MRLGLEAELVADSRCRLGEGPVWDVASGRLIWTDILDGVLQWFDPSTGGSGYRGTVEPVTALAPRRSGGFIAATARGVALLDAELSRLEFLCELASDSTRMNDGKCDANGRFWVGSMALDPDDGGIGHLYCVDERFAVRRVLADVTISNGLDWADDGGAMYYVDSGTGGIDVFAFDGARGEISARRRLVTVTREDGLPDGLCVDSEGCVWVAIAYAGEIRRFEPTGELLQTVSVPASVVTSCCFGGDLTDLYVTSAAEYVKSERRMLEQGAGGLFRCAVGVRGNPPHAFAG
jgi:sugar lactone lactonase YvrE